MASDLECNRRILAIGVPLFASSGALTRIPRSDRDS